MTKNALPLLEFKCRKHGLALLRLGLLGPSLLQRRINVNGLEVHGACVKCKAETDKQDPEHRYRNEQELAELRHSGRNTSERSVV